MRILVTNDDGIDAPGLHAVVSALAAHGHDVSVVAPTTDRSGSGAGLGSIAHGVEIAVEERELPGLPSISALAVDAPPAFAVLASCTGTLGPRPDIVVSGINDGHNTGRLILTSSTVGAALMAGGLGARGLAVSSGFAPDHRFDTAAQIAVAAVAWLIESSEPRTVLNVNVPNLGLDELRGVSLAELSPRSLMGLRLERTTGAVRLNRFENIERLGSGTDSALVHEGYAALSFLTPISTVDATTQGDPATAVERLLRGQRSLVADAANS